MRVSFCHVFLVLACSAHCAAAESVSRGATVTGAQSASVGAVLEDDEPEPANPLEGLPIDAADVLCLVGLLAVVLMVNNMLQKYAVPVPESIATVAIGVVAGGAAVLLPQVNHGTFAKLEVASARQFMLIFIAPIIFAEGYGMESHKFFENITRILLHAFVGTTISAILVAAVVCYLPPLTGLPLAASLTFAEGLAFGALISSTDPVTTLAIFKEQRLVEQGLSYLYYSVMGESLLNDAVAITLFDSLSELIESDGILDGKAVLNLFLDFCWTFAGSTAIGLAGGWITALVLKSARLGSGGNEEEHFYFNVPEIGVALVLAYVPYLVAEATNLSGIVAIMFAGITMRHYAHYNLTHVTRQVYLPTIELLASLCETYVFVLLGLGVFLLRDKYYLSLIGWSALACLVGRAANVYPLAQVANYCSSATPLSFKEQHVQWFAGLRGAIAFICALGFPESPSSVAAGEGHRDSILCTTVVLVGASLLFLGWPTAAVMRCLDIRPRDDEGITAALRAGRRRSWLPERGISAVDAMGKGLRKILMTSEAYSEHEADSVAQRSSDASGIIGVRSSVGTLRPSHSPPLLSLQHGTPTTDRSDTGERMSLGDNSGKAVPILRSSAPAGNSAAAAAAAARGAEATPINNGRLSAPSRFVLPNGAGRQSDSFRSARTICNP